jgi:predicted permease
MISTLIQMTLLMACGGVWRVCRPAGLSAEQTRLVLTTVVYYLLMPAMILEVLWQADIGVQSLQYTILGVASMVFAITCIWLIGRLFKLDNKHIGTMMLAGAFPNVTYLGLPVLEQTFGNWARSVVIQMDLFATAPFLFTIGVMIVRHYGEDDKPQAVWRSLNAPPFWTAAVAVALNLNGVAAPDWLAGVLHQLSAAAAPLMIFALGLALDWRAVSLHKLPYVIPIVLIKMLVMPLGAWLLVRHLDLEPHHQAAAVLDLAMPSMLLGIVFCDRFRLDSPLYAMTVTLTTLSSLFTLPLWHGFLTQP